ncbi:hypothetical protein U8527_18485 [Kordia algicida OT-1]|uniref:Lipoprotein n=1 Tax=Kordia algicida OT-1 TaxID=391587 RepID=A9DIX2_9FLAO|nr:hypothetical protein [Kordia algicida]EDP97982.1 hypothetical protein KAOT1_12232 [Kordia algicida OT-1]
MKNKFLKTILALSVICLALHSCKDDDTLPVDFDDLINTGLPFASEITTNGSTNVNKLDPASSSFSKDYQLVSPAGGTDITKVEVFVSITGQNITAPEALLTSVDASSFTASATGGYPEVNISFDGASIISALGINATDLEGGDTFDYRLALTNPQGTFSDVSANFDNQSADHTFSSTVVCDSPTLPAGTWTIDMQDSYGDGWQPTSGNGGGPGITITLSDGSVIELGLCTPYEPPGYACTTGLASGTETFTIPANVSGDFTFNGDFWGEMSYQIYGPSGSTVATGNAGASAGPIALNLCNE